MQKRDEHGAPFGCTARAVKKIAADENRWVCLVADKRRDKPRQWKRIASFVFFLLLVILHEHQASPTKPDQDGVTESNTTRENKTGRDKTRQEKRMLDVVIVVVAPRDAQRGFAEIGNVPKLDQVSPLPGINSVYSLAHFSLY